MKPIKFCSHCLYFISKFGNNTVKVYKKICESFVYENNLFYLTSTSHLKNNELNKILRTLELYQYIVTTERDKNLIVAKPLGLEMISFPFFAFLFHENPWSFCIDPDNHKKKGKVKRKDDNV